MTLCGSLTGGILGQISTCSSSVREVFPLVSCLHESCSPVLVVVCNSGRAFVWTVCRPAIFGDGITRRERSLSFFPPRQFARKSRPPQNKPLLSTRIVTFDGETLSESYLVYAHPVRRYIGSNTGSLGPPGAPPTPSFHIVVLCLRSSPLFPAVAVHVLCYI